MAMAPLQISKATDRNDQQRTGSKELETLNFKVPPEFKRAFKGYAVSQGVSMVELLREGFELIMQKRKA
jgi:hypothetical protein